MPIGLLIGALIGTLIIGAILTLANNDFHKQSRQELRLASQKYWMTGWSMSIISAFALIGTFIELAVR